MSEQASCRPERVADDRPARPPSGDVPSRLQWLVSAHLDVDAERLRPETRLGEDLCVDSLAAIELTMVIEDEFDISLRDEEVADVLTYGDVLSLVLARTGNGAV